MCNGSSLGSMCSSGSILDATLAHQCISMTYGWRRDEWDVDSMSRAGFTRSHRRLLRTTYVLLPTTAHWSLPARTHCETRRRALDQEHILKADPGPSVCPLFFQGTPRRRRYSRWKGHSPRTTKKHKMSGLTGGAGARATCHGSLWRIGRHRM